MAAYSPLHALMQTDREAMSAVARLAPLLEEKKKVFTRRHEEDVPRQFSDSMFDVEPRVLPGTSVFGPPYDYEWTEFLAASDRAAGTFKASVLGGNTAERFQSGAGLGLPLTSPATVNVRVSAYLPIHFDWSYLIVNGSFYPGRRAGSHYRLARRRRHRCPAGSPAV